ncbi:MAG: M28 family peptidase [Cyclobacteriaceae bacterium]
MKTLLTFTLLTWIGLYQIPAQDKQATKYARTITAKDLKARLSVLASDSLEGRDTGSKGQKIAANYIAQHFESIGLSPVVSTAEGESFFQSFDLKKGTINQVYLRKGEELKENLQDFLYYSRSETFGEEYIELLYLENLNDTDLDLSGKHIVFRTEANDWQKVIAKVKEKNPAGYLVINEDAEEFDFMLKRFGAYFERPSIRSNFDNSGDQILMIDPSLLEWAFEKKLTAISHGDEARIIFNADMLIEPLETSNVLGYLKGSERPDELIIITSHYDHVGIINGEIHNGADDDGSGTTTVMEIAEAFASAAAKGKGPKRSILFMCVTGEEKGLLGSKYYTENPIFPLEKTITNLNIDMVGRVDPKYEELNNPNYIYIIGSDKLSQELHDLHESVNEKTEKLALDYTYNDENDPNRFYYRSDHYNFAKNNIPIIFYFNGTHADYHKPTDTIEKIHFEKMQKIARLVYYTAWEIANREGTITADKLEGK